MNGQIQSVVRAELRSVIRVYDFALRCKRCNVGGNIISGGTLDNEENKNRN